MFVNWHVCVQVCVRTDFIRIYPKLLFTANVSSRFSYGSVQYKAERYYGWWRLGEVRSALCVKFLSGITYAISELSHEKIDLYNPQKASLTKRTTKKLEEFNKVLFRSLQNRNRNQNILLKDCQTLALVRLCSQVETFAKGLQTLFKKTVHLQISSLEHTGEFLLHNFVFVFIYLHKYFIHFSYLCLDQVFDETTRTVYDGCRQNSNRPQYFWGKFV